MEELQELQLISTIEIPYTTIEGDQLVRYEQYIDGDKIKSYKHVLILNGEKVDEFTYIDTFDTLQEAEQYIENNLI